MAVVSGCVGCHPLVTLKKCKHTKAWPCLGSRLFSNFHILLSPWNSPWNWTILFMPLASLVCYPSSMLNSKGLVPKALIHSLAYDWHGKSISTITMSCSSILFPPLNYTCFCMGLQPATDIRMWLAWSPHQSGFKLTLIRMFLTKHYHQGSITSRPITSGDKILVVCSSAPLYTQFSVCWPDVLSPFLNFLVTIVWLH